MGFAFPFEHMTIEYFTEKCPHVAEGTKFRSPSEVGALWARTCLRAGAKLWKFRASENNPTPGRNPPNQLFIPATISFIVSGSAASHRIVIYSDATTGNAAGAWEAVSDAAKRYDFAEHNPKERSLQNWPNSMYQLFGNNSNTFIRVMARTIGRMLMTLVVQSSGK